MKINKIETTEKDYHLLKATWDWTRAC